MAACKFVGYRQWIKWYDTYSQKYDKIEEGFAGVVVYGEGVKKEKQKKINFLHTSIVIFEGQYMKAPADVDLYLKQMYGDYLKLPPENERKVHPSNVYWKEGYGK